MKRHIKKHLKELKRRRKKFKLPSPLNKYWPTIYCLNEKIFIGVSYETVKSRYGRIKKKVLDKDWINGICKFRSPEYVINMGQYKDGDIVYCPKCGGHVDFRIWVSATMPEFTNVKKDSST